MPVGAYWMSMSYAVRAGPRIRLHAGPGKTVDEALTGLRTYQLSHEPAGGTAEGLD